MEIQYLADRLIGKVKFSPISSPNSQHKGYRKANPMSTNPSGAKPTAKASETPAFVIVDAAEISYVKRGRKAVADPELIANLKLLSMGQALRIVSMKLDPTSANYATEKSRIASQIRTACKAANLSGFSIKWSPEGIPQVVA